MLTEDKPEPLALIPSGNQDLILDLRLVFASISIDSVTGCWNWVRYKNPDGYAYLYSKWKRKNVRAIRLVCEIFHGLQDDDYVLHACDNPSCVSPAHLRPGTPLENSRDIILRARSTNHGENHHLSKLTEDQVRSLVKRKLAGETAAALAREVGVPSESLRRIFRQETWVRLSRSNASGFSRKFSRKEVETMVERHLENVSFRAIARDFPRPISYTTVASIVRGEVKIYKEWVDNYVSAHRPRLL